MQKQSLAQEIIISVLVDSRGKNTLKTAPVFQHGHIHAGRWYGLCDHSPQPWGRDHPLQVNCSQSVAFNQHFASESRDTGQEIGTQADNVLGNVCINLEIEREGGGREKRRW